VYNTGPLPADAGFYSPLLYDDAANMLGDSGGYNFRYIITDSAYHFSGGHDYRIQITSLIGSSSHMQIYKLSVGEVL
jgi:hypothetical protein